MPVFFREDRIDGTPVNAEIGITPQDPALRFRRIVLIRMIQELRVIRQRNESMPESAGDQKLFSTV